MKRLVLFIMLFLPLPTLANIKSYARGFSDMWCDDKNCYLVSTTNMDYTMPGHKTSAVANLRAPDGITSYKATGLVAGSATARVSLSHNAFKKGGYWDGNGNTGEVYCEYSQRSQVAQSYVRRKQLGSSIICMERSGAHIDPKVCTRIYALGLQIGWQCTYIPIYPCGVKCQASLYSIYIVGNGNIIPAPRGEIVKAWELDIDNGNLKCGGIIMPFFPGPCVSCKEKVIGTL